MNVDRTRQSHQPHGGKQRRDDALQSVHASEPQTLSGARRRRSIQARGQARADQQSLRHFRSRDQAGASSARGTLPGSTRRGAAAARSNTAPSPRPSGRLHIGTTLPSLADEQRQAQVGWDGMADGRTGACRRVASIRRSRPCVWSPQAIPQAREPKTSKRSWGPLGRRRRKSAMRGCSSGSGPRSRLDR